MRTTVSCSALALFICVAVPAAAQQTVPIRNGIPVAPTGLVVPPMPDKPVVYHTAEGQDIRAYVFTHGLKRPWSIAFLPNGDMLVTERGGQLRLVHKDGSLEPQPVAGLPEVKAQGLSGLHDIALHPQFATNHFVYLSYNKPAAEGHTALGIARGVWDGHALTKVSDVYVAEECGRRLAPRVRPRRDALRFDCRRHGRRGAEAGELAGQGAALA